MLQKKLESELQTGFYTMLEEAQMKTINPRGVEKTFDRDRCRRAGIPDSVPFAKGASARCSKSFRKRDGGA